MIVRNIKFIMTLRTQQMMYGVAAFCGVVCLEPATHGAMLTFLCPAVPATRCADIVHSVPLAAPSVTSPFSARQPQRRSRLSAARADGNKARERASARCRLPLMAPALSIGCLWRRHRNIAASCRRRKRRAETRRPHSPSAGRLQRQHRRS